MKQTDRMTHKNQPSGLQRRRRSRNKRARVGDLGPAFTWPCPECGQAASARIGEHGRTVATCRNEQCGFAGLTDHRFEAA